MAAASTNSRVLSTTTTTTSTTSSTSTTSTSTTTTSTTTTPSPTTTTTTTPTTTTTTTSSEPTTTTSISTPETTSLGTTREALSSQQSASPTQIPVVSTPQSSTVVAHGQGGGPPTILITAYSVVGGLALLLVLLVAVLLWCYFARIRVKKGGRYKPLWNTYKDVRNTMDFTRLIKKAGNIIASEKAAEEFVKLVVDAEVVKLEARPSDFVFLNHARLPGLKLKKSTRLVLRGIRRGGERLHMTKLHDYFGNTILLSQAPLPPQFVDQWKAIWQEWIGIVVWVGPFIEGDEVKMDPYIALREQGRIRCGEFGLETTMAIRKPGEYDSYLVQVKLGRATRLVTFHHIHMWPDSGTPLAPAKLADFMERLQEQQLLKEQEHNLPNLLIHCSAGLQRSPTLLAVYIARQMWMLENKVNLLGVFRYIRRRRYKTLGLGYSIAQVQIAFGTMQIFAMRREMGKVGALTVEAHERNVFDPRQRQEEVDTSDTTLASFSSTKTSDLEKVCDVKGGKLKPECKLLMLKIASSPYKKLVPKDDSRSARSPRSPRSHKSPKAIPRKEQSIEISAALLDSKKS